eukprot:CAMPEP_0118691034 /NCGR_PEP_ID=MMETSP0800-20121206/10453_1 /TAXON_ID=210618 ORGANISM="Striatella unipunctata, Strain CCMP2910" /NCGR_SAMPLE_ID=MMETSP0800 /ASSEMBLY_ACC=CAM_ASM_000638 /LENGTH=151 /DNA_ID=CAMNT_0006588763 /DNA_START=276 /DNA_END=731 /DNA_ORIENTATION=+
MAFLLQAILSGGPMMALVTDSPQAYYLIRNFMVFFMCMSILLLIFVPKILLTISFNQESASQQRLHIQNSIAQSTTGTRPKKAGNFKRFDENAALGDAHVETTSTSFDPVDCHHETTQKENLEEVHPEGMLVEVKDHSNGCSDDFEEDDFS